MSADTTNTWRRLSDQEVRTLRERFASGKVSQRQLAAEFSLTPYYVHVLVTGQARAGAGGPLHRPRRRRTLSDDEAAALRRAYARGTSRRALATRYGVSLSTISRVLLGTSHAAAGGPLANSQRP